MNKNNQNKSQNRKGVNWREIRERIANFILAVIVAVFLAINLCFFDRYEGWAAPAGIVFIEFLFLLILSRAFGTKFLQGRVEQFIMKIVGRAKK